MHYQGIYAEILDGISEELKIKFYYTAHWLDLQ